MGGIAPLIAALTNENSEATYHCCLALKNFCQEGWGSVIMYYFVIDFNFNIFFFFENCRKVQEIYSTIRRTCHSSCYYAKKRFRKLSRTPNLC